MIFVARLYRKYGFVGYNRYKINLSICCNDEIGCLEKMHILFLSEIDGLILFVQIGWFCTNSITLSTPKFHILLFILYVENVILLTEIFLWTQNFDVAQHYYFLDPRVFSSTRPTSLLKRKQLLQYFDSIKPKLPSSTKYTNIKRLKSGMAEVNIIDLLVFKIF